MYSRVVPGFSVCTSVPTSSPSFDLHTYIHTYSDWLCIYEDVLVAYSGFCPNAILKWQSLTNLTGAAP